jgi:ribosomal 30S subunit maturation factor RimM
VAASGRADENAAAPGVAARDWVELGRVLRPHGLDGGLLVALHSDDPANLLDAPTLALRGAPGTIPFEVESSASAGGGPGGRHRVRLHLAGIDSRERAVVWMDAAVLVPPGGIQALPEGEFYWRDLIGLEARSADGAGSVASRRSSRPGRGRARDPAPGRRTCCFPWSGNGSSGSSANAASCGSIRPPSWLRR